MPLSEAQLQEIREIIERYHTALIANVISPDVLTKEQRERLKVAGLLNPDLQAVRDAYLYGQTLAAAERAEASEQTFDEFKKELNKNPIALSEPEQRAVRFAEHQAAQYLRGLGNQTDIDTGQVV